MKKAFFIYTVVALSLLVSGCITSPVMINKMEVPDEAKKIEKHAIIVFDKNFLQQKHSEKQLGTTFEYDLGYYLKDAVDTSLSSVFQSVVQTKSGEMPETYDVVIKPKLASFYAPVPALVLMNTKTQATIEYEVIPHSPMLPFTLRSTGTFKVKNEQDQLIYNSLKSSSIYTYDAATNFGMAIPDYSYEAGKDAYMAIYHALVDLNSQLIAHFKDV